MVIGGAGFIGSHLCDRLVGQGHRVVCVDNFITGSRNNVSHLDECENFEIFNVDICDDLEFERILGYCNSGLDEVYYLASIASPVNYIKYPLETIDVNVKGLRMALDVAQDKGARLLYTSTSEVYGDPEEFPQTERYNGNVNTLGNRAVYDESKRLGETLCSVYSREHGVEAIIVRIFNTYGPRMASDDGRVIPAFVNAAIDNEPCTIYGDGEQTRSFCYVSDMIDGLLEAMTFGHLGPFNLGNPSEYYSINELHDFVQQLLDRDRRAEYREHITDNDPVERMPDIRVAEQFLNWKPKTNLETGLRITMEHYLSERARMESDTE